MAAGQLLARDAELAVGRRPVGEDDRVVALAQLVDGDVPADLDVAEEAELGSGGGLLVDADHRLDLRVVGSHAEADQPVRRRQPVEHVDLGVRSLVLEHVLGRVEAGRARPDDGDAQGLALSSDHSERERVVTYAGVTAVAAVPSSASSARPERHRHAGEDRGVAQGVGARLGGAELLDQVEELARLVALERDDELLVVEAERVGGVDRDLRMAAADLDVIGHDPPALLERQPVPLALLVERVDEEVLAVRDADLRPRLGVRVGRGLGHREVGVRRLGPAGEAALGEDDVEGVQVLEDRALAEQHQVDVAAGADRRIRSQRAVLGEVLAGRQELGLVGRPLLGGRACARRGRA